MGQTSNGQHLNNNDYSLLRELPNGAIVKESSGRLHFLKQYSFTNQEAYQQAFVNFSKKLPEKHQHILYLERTNTKLQNTFCSTFYKISLLYEYLDHSLLKEIQQRNQQNKIFDQKQVWSVLCSCVLGVSQMIRIQGRSHAALAPKDIRLNDEGLVKILALEMIGMESGQEVGVEGTTRQLAVTVLNCLLMEEINNDSEIALTQIIEGLQATNEMKAILKFMIREETKFIELEEYLFRMVQEETDSLNSYSNTPNLKEKPKQDNSYSKIPQESKEDDSLMHMPRDVQDCPQEETTELASLEQEIPDENDSGQESSSANRQSQENTIRESNTPQLSRNESPASKKFNVTGSQEHSLFTDPKLLNLIHSDLEEIKKRKSVAGSRKVVASDSKSPLDFLQSSGFQGQKFSNSQNISIAGKQNSKPSPWLKKDTQTNEFKHINLPNNHKETHNHSQHSQSSSNIRSSGIKEELNHSKTSSNIRNENDDIMWNGKQSAQFTNPERKANDKKYNNIMDNEDMGFKKHKKNKEQVKQQNTITQSIANSQNTNTVVYNSIQSNNPLNERINPNNYFYQKSKSSQVSEKEQNKYNNKNKSQLQYVTQTYIRGRFQGTKMNNMRHGKGVFYYNQGGKYIGDWKQNKMNGKGVLYYPNNEIAYDGDWKNDQLWGKGTLYNEEVVQLNTPFDYQDWEDVDDYWIKYEGRFAEDSKNGQGKLYLSNGEIFQGMFKDDAVWGEGVLTKRDGTKIRGLWRENKLIRIY